MSAARQVRPLDRSAEEKLLAVMEAVAGKLTRAQVWHRVSDDFSDEEELAKALGRLVADGRLVRESRPRPGSIGEEFIYGIPGRLDRIAAAAEAGRAPAARIAATKAAGELPTQRKEKTMEVDGSMRVRIREFIQPEKGFVTLAGLASALKASKPTVRKAVYKMLAAKELVAKGATISRRYGHPDAIDEPHAAAPGTATAAAPKARGPKRGPPKPNLADFGAPRPQLPVPRTAPRPGKLAWAIEDSGMVAINDGASTIRMSPEDIAYGVDFLEKTQLLWKRAA